MFTSPFRRGRQKNDPASERIAQFRAILQAAVEVPFYRNQMDAAGVRGADCNSLQDISRFLDTFTPLSWARYTSLFTRRIPGWRQVPDQRQTRSAMMVSYAEAREGLRSCKIEPPSYVDLYSPTAIAGATADLYRLGKAVANPPTAVAGDFNWDSDCAMVVFSGMDAGAFTAEQRNQLWDKYQVPVFEHLVGTDGRVIASECEVHAGLHIRLDGAILEMAAGEVVLTSLSDVEAPAIRVRTGLKGPIEDGACNCGRVEPRIHTVELTVMPHMRAAVA